MKNLKAFRAAALAVILLGIVHLIATPFVLSMFSNLNKMQLLTFGYMFVSTGVALVFLGWIQYYTLKLSVLEKFNWVIIKTSVTTFTLFGIGAVASMWDNPFAYISLLLAVMEWYFYYKIRTK